MCAEDWGLYHTGAVQGTWARGSASDLLSSSGSYRVKDEMLNSTVLSLRALAIQAAGLAHASWRQEGRHQGKQHGLTIKQNHLASRGPSHVSMGRGPSSLVGIVSAGR